MYSKNKAAWIARYGERWLAQIEEQEENIEKKRVSIAAAGNGEKILAVENEGHIWGLNSAYNPNLAARLYAERYDEKKPFWIYFVFGMSDGRHIREMLTHMDETNRLIIFEPDEEIYCKSMENFDFTDLIENRRVDIYVGKMEDIERIVGNIIGYNNRKLIEVCILPGYDLLYTEQCKKYTDVVIQQMEMTEIHKNTYLHFNRNFPRNILYHMHNMIAQHSIWQIKQKLDKYSLTDIPVILVAAGPSLDKNIHEIKKAEGRAFIIVVDAAIKRVLKEGIRPDLVVTEDALVPDRFFETDGLEDVFWMATRVSRAEIVERYGKRVFYFGDTIDYWDKEKAKQGGVRVILATGGSVANTAFSAACFLGFKTIILVGQDLAFTGGQSHTSGIQTDKKANDDYIKGRVRVMVEDINGNQVETDAQMKLYKEWFERQFEKKKDQIRVIDATEGGARIKGTLIQPLAQTIEEECRGKLDIWQILHDIPDEFSEKQKQILEREYERLPEKADELERELELLLMKYKRVCELADAGVTERNVVEALSEAAEQNEIVDKAILMDLLAMYVRKEEYQLQENIFADEEIAPEDLAKRAIQLCEGYINGIQMMKEDIASVLGN